MEERRYHLGVWGEGHYPRSVGFEDGEIWILKPIDKADDWLLAQRVIEQDGGFVVAELRVVVAPRSESEGVWLLRSLEKPSRWGDFDDSEPAVPRGGMATRRVRPAISSGKAIAEARANVRRDIAAREMLKGMGLSHVDAPRFSAGVLEAPRRVGSRGRGDRYYAEVARAAVAAVDRGERAPLRVVADELGDGWSREAVRDTLSQARQRGLLDHPPRGRPVGQLTPRAEQLLRDAGNGSG